MSPGMPMRTPSRKRKVASFAILPHEVGFSADVTVIYAIE